MSGLINKAYNMAGDRPVILRSHQKDRTTFFTIRRQTSAYFSGLDLFPPKSRIEFKEVTRYVEGNGETSSVIPSWRPGHDQEREVVRVLAHNLKNGRIEIAAQYRSEKVKP